MSKKTYQFSFLQGSSESSKTLTYVISEKFDELLTSFCAYVEDNNVSISKLKFGLKGVLRQPTIFVDDEIFIHDDVNKLKDVADILLVIRSHCTFFNFRLLEKLIVLIKYSAGKHMMEEYKNDFCEYVQAISVSQIPHGIGVDREDCEYFCVKLDESFKSCRAMYINILKADLCKILKIKEECSYLATINEGSIRIIFQVTETIRNKFPLREESIKALSNLVYEKAKILKVGYDGKVYAINDDPSDGKNIIMKLEEIIELNLSDNIEFTTTVSLQVKKCLYQSQ